jgi:hypothetical protein
MDGMPTPRRPPSPPGASSRPADDDGRSRGTVVGGDAACVADEAFVGVLLLRPASAAAAFLGRVRVTERGIVRLP